MSWQSPAAARQWSVRCCMVPSVPLLLQVRPLRESRVAAGGEAAVAMGETSRVVLSTN